MFDRHASLLTSYRFQPNKLCLKRRNWITQNHPKYYLKESHRTVCVIQLKMLLKCYLKQ